VRHQAAHSFTRTREAKPAGAKKRARWFGWKKFSLAEANDESLAHVSANIWNCQRHPLA
jgi:hypothetical protein